MKKIDDNDFVIPTGSLVAVNCLWYGSSAKGAVIAKVTENLEDPRFAVAVRNGGAQASHTAYDALGRKIKTRVIPMPCFIEPKVTGVLGPGMIYTVDALVHELELLRDIDPYAVVLIDQFSMSVQPHHVELESKTIQGTISSTGTGIGAARAERVMRTSEVTRDYYNDLCSKHQIIREMTRMTNTVDYLNTVKHTHTILLEGTQGYLLGLTTGGFYPYATSEEISFESQVAACGLPIMFWQRDAIYNIAAVRAWPIRTGNDPKGGTSGPMTGGEVSWEYLSRISNGYIVPEIAGVSGRVRRVSMIDWDMLSTVLERCYPTHVAYTFVDYETHIEGNSSDWAEHAQIFEDMTGYAPFMIGMGSDQRSEYFYTGAAINP